MKINPVSSNEAINQYKGKVNQKTVAGETNRVSDTLELSEGAKSFAAVISELKGRLDTGSDSARVKAIADQIANGTYHVDSEKVAEKMLGLKFDSEA